MEDTAIIDLYWLRSEDAIRETAAKYGAYCRSIARGLLANAQDEEECVSDTWIRAWNAMPDDRPNRLKLFLGKITRRLACDVLYLAPRTEPSSYSLTQLASLHLL